MSVEQQIEQLLVWRLNKAMEAAPPPPRAAQLLELVRPWWELMPDQFQQLVDCLNGMQTTYGHAMGELRPTRARHPVASVVACSNCETECFSTVLYLVVHDRELRFRFHIDAPAALLQPSMEVTFVVEGAARLMFSADARLSVENEYGLTVELPETLAQQWKNLKANGAMPFRLILRPTATKG